MLNKCSGINLIVIVRVIFTIILMFLKLTNKGKQSPLCNRLRELGNQLLRAAKSNRGAVTGRETAARASSLVYSSTEPEAWPSHLSSLYPVSVYTESYPHASWQPSALIGSAKEQQKIAVISVQLYPNACIIVCYYICKMRVTVPI